MGQSKREFEELRQQEGNIAPVSAPAKKSIYNIHGDYLRLMDDIEANEGEITDEQDKLLSINREELEEKAVNYGYLMKQLDFDCQQITEEITRLSKISSQKERLKDNLKTRISEAMLGFNITKIQKNNLTLSFLKSEQLVIDDDATIPKRFIKTKEVETVDKKGLKEAVKIGEVKIPGIFILENQNLQIK